MARPAGEARPLLERCYATTTRLDVVSMQCDSAAALAWLAAADGDLVRARELCLVCSNAGRAARTTTTRSGACAGRPRTSRRTGAPGDARACAEALSAIAASASHPDALAALAHALAEIALAEGDDDAALQQFARAVVLHEDLDIPFEQAQILLRAGVALAGAGERESGLERLVEAHRIALGLRAEPLAGRAAAAMTAPGGVAGGAWWAAAPRPRTRRRACPGASSR